MLSLVTVIVVIAVACAHPSTYRYSRHRIVGGEDASIEEYPFQVAIETEFETFLCGGAIISDRIILSAAHPFDDSKSDEREPENYVARVGSSFRERDGNLYGFSSEQIVIHPNYGDEHKYDYDVAIMKLNEAIKFDLHAAKISLIPMGEEIEDDTSLIVTGYGQTSFDGTTNSENLQVATMPKRNRDACSALGDQKLTERMLCAGNGSPTTFHGDSGGPLTNMERKLVGIVSWGKQLPSAEDPVVFTNIANPSIHKFIMDHIS